MIHSLNTSTTIIDNVQFEIEHSSGNVYIDDIPIDKYNIDELNLTKIPNFKDFFEIPEGIYLVGNSLGALPKSTRIGISRELDKWGDIGVEGHLKGDFPWLTIDEFTKEEIARLVGANSPINVVNLNTLSSNLHLLLVSFYHPKGEGMIPKKSKILLEENCFPSDYYACCSYIEHFCQCRGFDNISENIENDFILSIGNRSSIDILNTIEDKHDEIALIVLGAVNYYTGEFYDIEKISKLCQLYNIYVILDCAHAIGNVPLRLHDWGIDGACWCSYKYLNSGPGGIGGIFIHEKHYSSKILKLRGWWSHDKTNRFQMTNYYPIEETIGANSWQLSNPSVLTSICLYESLKIFNKIDIYILRIHSILLSSRLESLLLKSNILVKCGIDVKTSHLSYLRKGAQLSLGFTKLSDDLVKNYIYVELGHRHVYVDYRNPGVIRVAPVPLYNDYNDIEEFVKILEDICENIQN